MARIIGIGETVLDIIFRNDKPQDAIPGGSTFNALISLGRMMKKDKAPRKVEMVTEVGDDHIGDIIIAFMRENGVSTDGVTRNRGTQSHISTAFLDANNDAQYEFYKDHANAGLDPSIVGRTVFGEGDLVLFGSFFAINPVIRPAVEGLLRKAKASGATLYYDINFRASHVKDLPQAIDNIRENCRLADFVRGSAEDFHYLFGTSDGAEIYERHIKPLCPTFILTKGAGPVEVHTPAGCYTYEVEQIDTVSTIGAGDNFNAGFLYSLHLGLSEWPDILSVATRFSSAVCRSLNNYVDEAFCL